MIGFILGIALVLGTMEMAFEQGKSNPEADNILQTAQKEATQDWLQ